MSLHPLFQQQFDTIFGKREYDPYALAREQVRSHAIETAAYERLADDAFAVCRRVGEQLDSVHALVVPVIEEVGL